MIVIADILSVLLILGSLIYSIRLYLETNGLAIWLIVACLAGFLVRISEVLLAADILTNNLASVIIAVATTIFYVTLLIAVRQLYETVKRFLRK